MLSLDSPRWSELTHAYGHASDIPDLLRRLDSSASSLGNAEPWFSLWSALAHQGDVYSASFATVPYVIELAASDPTNASGSCFHFPAWIEICRVRNNTEIPEDLRCAYFDALNKIPELARLAAKRPWDADFTTSVLSAIAASKHATDLAEAILELTPDVLADFKLWFESR